MMTMSGIDRHFDQPEDAGVSRLVKMGYLFVEPVNRQRVLNQIVCADTEKLHVTGQAVRRQHRGWHFDHGANF